jgi:hypothetical protein
MVTLIAWWLLAAGLMWLFRRLRYVSEPGAGGGGPARGSAWATMKQRRRHGNDGSRRRGRGEDPAAPPLLLRGGRASRSSRQSREPTQLAWHRPRLPTSWCLTCGSPTSTASRSPRRSACRVQQLRHRDPTGLSGTVRPVFLPSPSARRSTLLFSLLYAILEAVQEQFRGHAAGRRSCGQSRGLPAPWSRAHVPTTGQAGEGEGRACGDMGEKSVGEGILTIPPWAALRCELVMT